MQRSAYLSGGKITWWQKALALVGLLATIALAAVIGVILLYALMVLIIVAVLAGLFFYVRLRFFPPKRRGKKTTRGPDNITIIETPDGVVIDMPPESTDTSSKGRR